MDAAAAKALAERSGNSFQCRVLNYFRDNGWTVLLSPYYVDASSDKSRESDLIVEKPFQVHYHGIIGVLPMHSVRLRLFVECKYVAEKAGGAVFWTDPIDSMKARELVFSRPPFRPDHPSHHQQHYFQRNDPVAKLFTSEKQTGEENDPIYKALNQCLNGYIYNKERDALIPLERRERATTLDYPVIIYSTFGRFYSTSVAQPADPAPVEQNFLTEVDYAYLHPSGAVSREYFLVDMVDFTKINAFVESLRIEAEAAADLLGYGQP